MSEDARVTTDVDDTAPHQSRALPDPLWWHLVIPVKDADLAKTRLEAPLPLSRPELARAVAQDTIEAACAAVGPGQVTVVTSDVVVRAATLVLGAGVVPDPREGLNRAVVAGWESAGTRDLTGVDAVARDGGRIGWAAMLGDLPALRPEDLRTALALCAAHPEAVVPDADGTGTVLLTSTVAPPVPRFGPGSAARHGESAVVLELDLPGLRRDVDVAQDLRSALALGVGRHTTLALRRGL